MENANYHLAKMAGIGGILMGHSHSEFPNAACTSTDCSATGVDKARKNLTLAADGSARSWRFTKVTTAGLVTFTSSSGKLAVAQTAGFSSISVVSNDDGSGRGQGVYAIDLSR